MWKMSDDFDEDDWFFTSVKDYDELFMYDLQSSAEVISWYSYDKLCISCSDRQKRCEIQQLQVPRKLLTADESGLSKDRDFKVLNGCFHDNRISEMISVAKSRLLITTEASNNDIRLWTIPCEDSNDIIEKKERKQNVKPTSTDSACAAVSMATGDSADRVAFGSHGDNVCVADLETGQVTITTSGVAVSDRLCGLMWRGPEEMVVCSRSSGQLHTLDTRTRDTSMSTPHSDTGTNRCEVWSVAASALDGRVYTVNERGDVIVHHNQHQEKISLHDHQENHTESHRYNHTGIHPPTIKTSPTQAEVFSLSGFDGSVRIYNLSTDTKKTLSPVFTHQGHMTNTCGSHDGVKVTDHMWHPSIPQLLISADNKGSLHAWKYCIR